MSRLVTAHQNVPPVFIFHFQGNNNKNAINFERHFSDILSLSSSWLTFSVLFLNKSSWSLLESVQSFKIRVYIYRTFLYSIWRLFTRTLFFCFSQIYNLLYNGTISKYVVRKHLCGAIIQWWFSYIYSALCCACLYRRIIIIQWWFSYIYSALCCACLYRRIIIIQWWFSYIYSALCCACLYSSSSLWSFKSEGHCRFSLRLTFNGLLNTVT
jgi:hypothetical protein